MMGVVVALLCTVRIGVADTEFRWFDVAGSVTPAFPVNRTVLTYITTDTNIGLVQPSGTPFLSSYDSGDDNFFTAKATINAPDIYWTDYMFNSGDSFVGKYAYAVLVDLDFASYAGLGSIPNGTQWGVSTLSEKIVKIDTEPATTSQDFTGGSINLIPEPGSAALVLFGAAAAFWRRRQNRR
jgi:hypothetical protein